MIYVIVVAAIIFYRILLFSSQNIRRGKNHQLLNQVQSTLLSYNLSYIILYKPIDY